MKKLLLLFLVLGLSLVYAKSYRLTLYESSILGSTELKPGEYTLELKDQTVVLKNGKAQAEAPVKVENEPSKFPTTTVRYSNGDGKYKITEIRLGGTHIKLVMNN